MEMVYYREYSYCLNREMEYKIYGHDGKLCLVFPSQNGRFFEWEDRGMIHAVSKYIDEGKLRMVTCDSIDLETWSFPYDTKVRLGKHELWMDYIMHELVPNVENKLNYEDRWMTMGCSLGASHATNILLRYPYKFDQLLGMSGIYDLRMFYGGYSDFNTIQNNPMEYIANMEDVSIYKDHQMIFCVGQGNWEQECVADLRKLESLFQSKGIDAWFDYWGYDVYHDWPWWLVQLDYFMKSLMKEE